MSNNMFTQIKSVNGEIHYVNPDHIIDITDITTVPEDAPSYCQVYLTNEKSFTTFEPAISIVERIYSQYGEIANSYINTK